VGGHLSNSENNKDLEEKRKSCFAERSSILSRKQNIHQQRGKRRKGSELIAREEKKGGKKKKAQQKEGNTAGQNLCAEKGPTPAHLQESKIVRPLRPRVRKRINHQHPEAKARECGNVEEKITASNL